MSYTQCLQISQCVFFPVPLLMFPALVKIKQIVIFELGVPETSINVSIRQLLSVSGNENKHGK